jgi:hypothetical protein
MQRTIIYEEWPSNTIICGANTDDTAKKDPCLIRSWDVHGFFKEAGYQMPAPTINS